MLTVVKSCAGEVSGERAGGGGGSSGAVAGGGGATGIGLAWSQLLPFC